MASIYRRKNSPYWWIKWRDPETGEIRRESTKFRIGLGTERKKALNRRNALALTETRFSRSNKKEQFSNWVPDYIAAHYKDLTLDRVQATWAKVSEYLQKLRIDSPGALRRSHCIGYFNWRILGDAEIRRAAVRRSTAVTEIAYLRAILSEAVLRGFIDHNPAKGLGLKAEAPKPKHEITDDEIAHIRREIEACDSNEELLCDFRKIRAVKFDAREFLHVSFEVGLHQGCRLKETYFDVFADVNLDHLEIRFHAKGDKYYTTVLNPKLIPLIQRIRASGRKTSYALPEGIPFKEWQKLASFFWSKFFARIGLPHISFHCTRVTCISKLERSGAPEYAVMKLVNHASTTVHRIYQRASADDLRKFWNSSHP